MSDAHHYRYVKSVWLAVIAAALLVVSIISTWQNRRWVRANYPPPELLDRVRVLEQAVADLLEENNE